MRKNKIRLRIANELKKIARTLTAGPTPGGPFCGRTPPDNLNRRKRSKGGGGPSSTYNNTMPKSSGPASKRPRGPNANRPKREMEMTTSEAEAAYDPNDYEPEAPTTASLRSELRKLQAQLKTAVRSKKPVAPKRPKFDMPTDGPHLPRLRQDREEAFSRSRRR